MSQAKKDDNQVNVALGTSNADGSTPLMIRASPTTHLLDMDDGLTGSDLSGDVASRDNNLVPVIMGVSSADGVTPVAIYIDSTTNKILINSS